MGCKSKVFFFDGNFDYYNYDPEPPSLSYPLLVPFNLYFYYSIFFQYHYFSKIVFIPYLIFLILFLYSSLKFFKLNRTYSLVISTLIATCPEVFINATIAYADLTMTFFYSISTILLFYYIITKKRYYLLYSSIFLGLMAWSKHEGFALLVVNVFTFIIYNIVLLFKKQIAIRNSLQNILVFFNIGFIIYLPWLIFTVFNNLSYKNYDILTLFDIQHIFSDLLLILKFLIIPQNFYNASFLLFWAIFYFILLVNINKEFKEEIFILLLFCFFHFLLYIVFYIIYPSGIDLEWQLSVSLNRELLHLTPTCGFTLGILLSRNKKNLLDIRENSIKKIIVYSLGIFFCNFYNY